MTDIKQLSREAAEKWFADAEPATAYDRVQKENAVTSLASIIESVLTNSDLFREGYERAKEDAVVWLDQNRPMGHKCINPDNAAICIVCSQRKQEMAVISALTPDRKE